MHLIGRSKIYQQATDSELGGWIAAWTSEVQKAYWKQPGDVLKQYPQALHNEPNSFIFNMNSSGAILVVSICFMHQIALIVDCRRNSNINSQI